MCSLHPNNRSLLLLLLLSSLLLFLFLLPAHSSALESDGVGCGGGRYIRNVGGESLVCVCGVEGCPPLLPSAPPSPTHNTAPSYTTSKDGLRLREAVVEVVMKGSEGSGGGRSEAGVVVVEIGVEAPRQVVNGFGGSFTDSAALTMLSLSPPALDALLRAYFSPEGLEYNLIRVPIGGSDFSTRPYTLADTPSIGSFVNLTLAEEDVKYKLPLLRRALGLGRRPPRVLASPWSAPPWMKSNAKINESGELLRPMWGMYADYLVKFIHAYEKAEVPIWAITTQNHAFTSDKIKWNSMYWRGEDMRDWIKTELGPALEGAGLGRVAVYVGDDTRDKMRDFSRVVLNDPDAARYITGLAVHWYTDPLVHPRVLDHLHYLHPSKDILYTEACIVSEWTPEEEDAVVLGSWRRAELYATFIIQSMNHFSSGFIDWNLCLDLSGGPNWAGNVVDAPVIINQERDEFYLQPMFFVMGHFSKFVVPGSVSLPSWVREEPVEALHTAAFLRPSGDVVLQLLNTGDAEMEVRVEWEGGTSLHTLLPPRSLQTLLLPLTQGQCEKDTCGGNFT